MALLTNSLAPLQGFSLWSCGAEDAHVPCFFPPSFFFPLWPGSRHGIFWVHEKINSLVPGYTYPSLCLQ